MERPESIPLGSPPRTARRGMEPCSPVNPFFLDGGFFRRLCWGPGAHFCFQSGGDSRCPWRFSLGPLQRPVLFLRQKENGGLGALPLGKERSAAFGAQNRAWPRSARNPRPPQGKPSSCGPWPHPASPPAAGIPRPRAARGLPLYALRRKQKKSALGALYSRSRGGRRASLAFMESAISPPPPWAALLTRRTSHAPPRRKTARKAIPAVREGSSPARLPVGK